MDEVYSHLLRVSSVPTIPPSSTGDHSVMASQVQSSGEQGGDHGNRGKRPKCNYCHKWGHTKEQCYKLHGHPPRVNVVHTDGSRSESFDGHPPQSVLLTGADYDEYLKYKMSQ